MTLEQFTDIFVPLAMQLRNLDADEATIRAYYRVLADLEVEFVQMAAARIATARQDEGYWFPKAPEWRQLAGACESARMEQLRAVLRKLPTPLCLACHDTFWTRDESLNHVSPCACRKLRRLEVLGRRPMPLLPERLDV